MPPLFFVHIPKTAGTSFRLGAEAAFGAEAIAYDYGAESEVTSALVKRHLYGDLRDLLGFGRASKAAGHAMVGGHVNADRFVSLFGVGRTLTFLREPLPRIASGYAHFVRHYNYKGSFRDFYSRPVMQNRQSRFLQGVDLEAVGLLGLTERYGESLELLNAHFGTAIPLRQDNRGTGSLAPLDALSAEERAELTQLNRRDIALYARAAALVEARLESFRAGRPWAHARLVETNAKRVAGWAWWADARDARWRWRSGLTASRPASARPWTCAPGSAACARRAAAMWASTCRPSSRPATGCSAAWPKRGSGSRRSRVECRRRKRDSGLSCLAAFFSPFRCPARP